MDKMDTGTGVKPQKWGWRILLVVSAMLVLNGMGWFFMGPSLSTFEQDTGVPLSEFKQTYPTVAHTIALNARQVAIWFMAFGLLALLLARQGYYSGSQHAWTVLWILVAAPAAVGINVWIGGQSPFGIGMLGVAAIALVGILLARKEPRS